MLQLQATTHDGHPCLALTGALTIYTVTDAKQDLENRLGRSPILEIDLSQVEELDTAGVQLLLWLKRSAAEHGTTLALTGHSQAVLEVLDLLKVTGILGDPILIPPSAS